MKKLLLSSVALLTAATAFGQIQFDPTIDTAYTSGTMSLPAHPLMTQVLFIGGHHKVQTTAHYGNAAGEALAKQWHDFIGFTPDNSGSGDLGWVSVNHERINVNDSIGDGGGMTVFKIRRDAATDSIEIVSQNLSDGRTGDYFAVDFANTVGETGMNCGGINSPSGRIWTAEEWFRGSNTSIADRDTADFTIGTGTATQSVSNGFPGFDGQTVKKYENYNYMVEVDPRQAVAIRKQYNWGRQPFEGGIVMPDNQTVYMGADATPGFFTKFVGNTADDFVNGKTYVYKHDGSPSKWIEIDNTDFQKMLNFSDEAVAVGATMYNRLEWVVQSGGKVYFTETGRSNPGSRWRDEAAGGAVYAPHHLARGTAQGTHPDSSAYFDAYGRVLVYDPATEDVSVFLEGGPDFATSPAVNAYPAVHLSNPDGLGVIPINGQDYLLVQEDLNQTSFGSMPAGTQGNRACEMFLLDLSIANPTLADLKRIAVTPVGAEITGGIGTSDGKTVLVNSQHPSSNNPFPWNNSVTVAITGWDRIANFDVEEYSFDDFSIWPNPVARELTFSRVSDVAIYNNSGQRVRVYRQVNRIDVYDLKSGLYYLVNDEGKTIKFVVE